MSMQDASFAADFGGTFWGIALLIVFLIWVYW